jgi:hypothetical protein
MVHDFMNIAKCTKCGKEVEYIQNMWENPCSCEPNAEWMPFVDEYDSGKASYDKDHEKPIAEDDESLIQIMAYCVEGSNEGVQAHLAALFSNEGGGFGCKGLRYVHLYWIKSFQDMDHVHEMAKRLSMATGCWNAYGDEKEKYHLVKKLEGVNLESHNSNG